MQAHPVSACSVLSRAYDAGVPSKPIRNQQFAMKQQVLIACIVLTALLQPASGTEHIWSGASNPANTLWNDVNNFDGSAIVDGDSVTFLNAGSVSTAGVVDNVADAPPLL